MQHRRALQGRQHHQGLTLIETVSFGCHRTNCGYAMQSSGVNAYTSNTADILGSVP